MRASSQIIADHAARVSRERQVPPVVQRASRLLGEVTAHRYALGFDPARRGFLARVRLEELGTGSIYPHEQPMPGPKADRLALWEHGRTCLSPVFGLYPAAAGVQGPLDAACDG